MLERIHQGVDITLFWLAGIALIVAGVMVINLFSASAAH